MTVADAFYFTSYGGTHVYRKRGETRRRAAYERPSRDGRDLYKNVNRCEALHYVVCAPPCSSVFFTNIHTRFQVVAHHPETNFRLCFCLKGCWKGIFSSAVCQNVAIQNEREISMVLNIQMAMREPQRANCTLHQQH